jgi:23S rRNA pseudouridine2605 synthase
MASSSKKDPNSKRQQARRKPAISENSKLNKPFSPKKGYISKTEREGLIRLNRFLSNAGIASRREADKLIEMGLVTVNGKIVTELGTKIDPHVDVVRYDDVNLKPEKMRYVLLNKPKDFITTMDDPEGRRTVMSLVANACKERIYPVGRLDRNTTGLLLFTNDGEMAKRLTHPKHGYPKLYHVETIEKVKPADLDKMREGIKLDDGFVKVDEVEFVSDGKDQKQVGLRIHTGKNRVVRRIFETLGYTVRKLDRVMFAGLTKKDLPRGRYRHLTEQEINFLKMIR